MELTHELREHSGLQWVLDRLVPLSPFGRAAARAPRWYGPGEEAALADELDNLALSLSLWDAKQLPEPEEQPCCCDAPKAVRPKEPPLCGVTRCLPLFHDIRGSFDRDPGNPFDLVELFEIKHFLVTLEQVQKKKKKRRVWWIVGGVVVALIIAGILIYRASLKSSVDALLLLKDLSGRRELDMTASVQMDLGDETLQTDARLFRTQAGGNTILCIEENGVQLYYYDGAIYLENGSAYRTNGLFPDYSTLGEHLLELYNATDVTYARESGEEVYSVTAYGKDAEQALSLLTPTIADSLSAVESIDLCMHVEDGVIRSIEASGSCQAENSAGQMQPMTVWAELTVQPDAQTAHAVPAAVTDAIANGGYQGKLELTEDLLRVLSAASELGRRDPLAARVQLSANCGPVIFDTSLDYTRTVKEGKTVSCIRAGVLELYFSGETVLSKDGRTPTASEQTLVKCADLIDLAYRACLEDSVTSEQTENGWRYTLSLSAEQTKQAACAIAPEAEKLDVQYLPGTLELDVQDGAITALRVTTGGSVQVGVVDTQVSISAQFDLQTDLSADDCTVPDAVLEKL